MTEEREQPELVTIREFQPHNIFVCFDGSDHSIRALSAAISLASRFNSMVIVTHAVPLPFNGYGLGEPYYDWDLFEKSARNRIEKILRPFIEASSKMGVSLKVNFLGGTISVVESLLTSSEKENSDMIIMGSRGLGGFRGLMMGSVSQAIVANSKVPVMIIK